MNKKELIEKIANLDRVYGEKYYVALEDVLDLVKQLDEPEKVKVQQFVADWIEVCKEHLTSSLYLAMTPSFLKSNNQGIELTLWIKKNEETFARAWLDGYTVEKEKRYRVKMKNIIIDSAYLKHQLQDNHWYWGSLTESNEFSSSHTKNELEVDDFGWVFDCEGIEVEEVEE